ncbi:PREDICTED: uncharacterized protein LOC109340533 [Lupinus angustifolius]|uniref:uncharacterized protein LOC109340533 n=1 Tax=Lupinus angustifolius TaxID=3871 RepID=UPI00092E93B5|nr:PREDICTED: uncharacterized protein LOC109340533 [Lupinus angustifolius]
MKTKLYFKNLCLSNKPDFVIIVEPKILNLRVSDRSLWKDVQKLISDFPRPWCCIGDFNVVLGANECRSSRLPARIPCTEFQAFIDQDGLNSPGPTEELVQPRQSSFKFHKMWLLDSDCRRLVAEVWRIQVLGCPMYVLSQKLRNLKNELKIWNKNVFGNIDQRVNSAKANVDAIQNSINDHGPDSNLLEQENLAQSELLIALEVEEAFWMEKAKINWHSMGDRNTSFFHRMTNIRNGTKSLSMLKYGNSTLTSKEDIENHVLDYNTNLFASPNIVVPNSLIQDVIPRLVTDSDNLMLTIMPSLSEIKDAVFALNEEGAPGPNGFSGCFFQNFWDIINKEVCNDVLHFFKQSWLMPNINSNSVILIQKLHGADRIEDYRPIALANFQFKIITKVLADRLAAIAPRIISNQQRGFIKERQIKDCICLASEAINMLDHKTFGSNLAIKLDIKKPFDTIEWTFLLDTLQAFGFNSKFIH